MTLTIMSPLSILILVLRFIITPIKAFILPTTDDFLNGNIKSWQVAEEYCLNTYNTHLVSIHDENTFNSILDALSAISQTDKSFYIGLSNPSGENISDYIWSDGSTFDYGTAFGEVPWGPQTPNQKGQDYIFLSSNYNPLRWDDSNGGSPYYWICNSPLYVFSDERMNGNEANAFCKSQNPSLELISIHSNATFKALQQSILIREDKFPDGQSPDNYMIGLRRNGSDPTDKSSYYWTDGTSFDYGNIVNETRGVYPWHDPDPNLDGTESSCIRLQNTASLLWDDVNCTTSKNGPKGIAICLNRTITASPTTSQPTYAPTAPITTFAPSTANPTTQPTVTFKSTPIPTSSPTKRPSASPSQEPTLADSGKAKDDNQTDPIHEKKDDSGGNAILNATNLVIIIIGCAIAACCFMFGGFYLMKKSKKVQTKDRDKMQIVTTSDGRTEIIPDSLHIIPSNSSDINNLLSSPSPQPSTYNNTMHEGNGIPLTTPPKRKNYGVIKKTNSNLDIETDALDTYEIGDDDEEQGDGQYGANGYHQGYRKADSSGDEDEDDMVVTKGNTVGDDNEIDPDQDRLIKKFKKSSTVGGDEDLNQQANIGRDEFVVNGDDDEYEYYEDEYEDDDDDERRKETAGFIDDEAHDGIVSDNEHEHDRFVIEGGIDENKPLDEIENEENEEKETPENGDDNDGVGNDEFVVIGDDDINIMTPNEDDPTDNGY